MFVSVSLAMGNQGTLLLGGEQWCLVSNVSQFCQALIQSYVLFTWSLGPLSSTAIIRLFLRLWREKVNAALRRPQIPTLSVVSHFVFCPLPVQPCCIFRQWSYTTDRRHCHLLRATYHVNVRLAKRLPPIHRFTLFI